MLRKNKLGCYGDAMGTCCCRLSTWVVMSRNDTELDDLADTSYGRRPVEHIRRKRRLDRRWNRCLRAYRCALWAVITRGPKLYFRPVDPTKPTRVCVVEQAGQTLLRIVPKASKAVKTMVFVQVMARFPFLPFRATVTLIGRGWVPCQQSRDRQKQHLLTCS